MGKKKENIIVSTQKPKLSLNTKFGCVCVNWEKQVKRNAIYLTALITSLEAIYMVRVCLCGRAGACYLFIDPFSQEIAKLLWWNGCVFFLRVLLGFFWWICSWWLRQYLADSGLHWKPLLMKTNDSLSLVATKKEEPKKYIYIYIYTHKTRLVLFFDPSWSLHAIWYCNTPSHFNFAERLLHSLGVMSCRCYIDAAP